ncbi:conjugal transfer protein TraD, partial [Nocardia cyriacigeorgica]|nr:conjugal transfer protein TraD [Nocardia cyriacigeorgica]
MANEQSVVPAAVLRAHNEDAVARMLTTKQNVTERQRDGYYDMARRFLESLDSQRYAKAILPNRRVVISVAADGSIITKPGQWVHSLPEFD